ncbi:hypothetical protein [Inhella gelatinilytica]|uniref:Uncharacterized protein n=1 Tax=Inhella gelatinilytica TaxID=2795030 RepID=A0A931IY46_9BURK|nr:hypothetical protein [Inhella gelatinilytica]MBH9553140.1 hypothetical protein [Inhella gelatinilytica]
MGGIGSGRKSGKRCTDDMRALDVRSIHRTGLLTPGSQFGWQWMCDGEVTGRIDLHVQMGEVVLSYRSRDRQHCGGEWETLTYRVWLDWTSCGLGGRRVWWRCPSTCCGRRVAVLYGGRIFACRSCNRLAYRCQREADDDRAARRAEAIRKRLNWEPGILNGGGLKPMGMHWRTFERLQREHDDHAKESVSHMAARFGCLQGTIGEIDPSLAWLHNWR